MEEILSSIKRIIAEDGDAPVRREPKTERRRASERESHRKAVVASLAKDADDGVAASSYVDEVLELTEEMPKVGQLPKAEEIAIHMENTLDLDELVSDTSLHLADEFELAEDMKQTSPEPVTLAPAAQQPAASPAPAASIVSSESEAAARSSLAALSSLLVKPSEPEAADNTLEGLVREMLRPMMKEWLDANLPRLVEGMVAKEIARITGRSL